MYLKEQKNQKLQKKKKKKKNYFILKLIVGVQTAQLQHWKM